MGRNYDKKRQIIRIEEKDDYSFLVTVVIDGGNIHDGAEIEIVRCFSDWWSLQTWLQDYGGEHLCPRT